jgi:hypothetical protein
MYRSRLTFTLAMVAMAAILVPSLLTAQTTFQRTFGGPSHDYGSSVQQTADGCYIVVGGTLSFGAGDYDVCFVRTDASGVALWIRTYGGTYGDAGYSVQQTADGGYIIAGVTGFFGPGLGDIYLVKTDASGDTLWTRAYGGARMDKGYEVQQTPDSGYIVAGAVCLGSDTEDVYLMRTNPSGDTLWTRTYGGSGLDEGNSLRATTDGGYIIAGITESFGSESADVYLLKTNASGDTLWTRTYGGPGYDEAYSVQQTTDSGYIITGVTESFGSGLADIYLIKTNASGDTLWTRTYGGTHNDRGNSVQQTTDGGYIVAGYTSSLGAGNRDAYLVKTNAQGDTVWTRTYGGTTNDVALSVRQTSDGGYVIAGWTYLGAGGEDVYLIKTDSLGNVAVSVAEPKAGRAPISALSLACEPSPCRGATVVSFQPQAASSEPATLRVYDAQGRLVHSEPSVPASSFRLDLRSMPAGTYFCRLESGDDLATAVLLKL